VIPANAGSLSGGTAGSGGLFTTFNGSVTGGTLSNGQLTYTHTSGFGLARSTAEKSSGKWYFEMTAANGIAGGGTNSCVAVITATATDTNVVNSGTSGGIVFQGVAGAIFSNDVSTGLSLGSNIADGDVIGVAVDLDNHNIWFRKSPSGNWNGQAIGSQNPATNTGGASLSNYNATTLAPAAGSDNGLSWSWTANFGASAFSGSVPAGFTSGWTA
jgi:hypothetical protein